LVLRLDFLEAARLDRVDDFLEDFVAFLVGIVSEL
jgi:hypothetical protein